MRRNEIYRCKRSSEPEPPVVARSEWDFSNCPADETWECRAYEFARSTPAIRDDVERLRKSLQKSSFTALVKALRNRIDATPRLMALFWYCPEFPNGPYLKIPVVERKRRSNALWPPAMIATVMTAKDPTHRPTPAQIHDSG